jgi:hypothetical protein
LIKAHQPSLLSKLPSRRMQQMSYPNPCSLPVVSLSILFFSANFKARLFSTFLDEYLLGISLSMKSNMKPHFACPTVGVEGLKDVFI